MSDLPLTFEAFIAKEMEPYYNMTKAYPVCGTATNEDYEKLEKKHTDYSRSSHWAHKQYSEQVVLSYASDGIEDVEMHQTYLIVNSNTGEVLNESHHVLTPEYIREKRKESNRVDYLKSKIKKKYTPTSGIKGNNYKKAHRHTKVFSKVDIGLSYKNKGIFHDLAKELSPYENIVCKQGNDKSFKPLSTKEIQDRLGLTKDDLKSFKSEAKKLGVISDVKLGGRQMGIRVNPAYAINGHQYSNDLYDAFKDSKEFTAFISDEDTNR